MSAIGGTQNVAAEKSEIAGEKNPFQLRGSITAQLRPTVAAAENRTILELDQAGILRPAKWMGVDQGSGFRPCFSVIA